MSGRRMTKRFSQFSRSQLDQKALSSSVVNDQTVKKDKSIELNLQQLLIIKERCDVYQPWELLRKKAGFTVVDNAYQDYQTEAQKSNKLQKIEEFKEFSRQNSSSSFKSPNSMVKKFVHFTDEKNIELQNIQQKSKFLKDKNPEPAVSDTINDLLNQEKKRKNASYIVNAINRQQKAEENQLKVDEKSQEDSIAQSFNNYIVDGYKASFGVGKKHNMVDKPSSNNNTNNSQSKINQNSQLSTATRNNSTAFIKPKLPTSSSLQQFRLNKSSSHFQVGISK